jgi:hypothetical protein
VIFLLLRDYGAGWRVSSEVMNGLAAPTRKLLLYQPGGAREIAANQKRVFSLQLRNFVHEGKIVNAAK